jgi:Ca-activated chloride channel homolog
MRIAAAGRTLAVRVVVLAAALLAASQLPNFLPPISALTPRPEEGAAPPAGAQQKELAPKAEPSARSDIQPTESAGIAAQQTQALAPSSHAAPADARAREGGADRFRLKADVNLVLVEATVRDQAGGVADNLKREDFNVHEDGVEQQVSYFSRDELPLAVALVIDRSGSMGPVLKQLRHAAYATLSLLKPSDQVALFAFAARAERLQDLTTDRRRVAAGIASIHAGGATVIADALFEATLYLSRAAPNRRHAIVLVSDNENTLKGYSDENRVIRQALEAEAAVYSIKVEEGLHPQTMTVLLPIYREISVPKIALETGGEVIEARDIESLRSAMATVISRLRQRYSLGYYTTNTRRDGAFRQIEIRIVESSGDSKRQYTVYARRGYYARSDAASSLNNQP